MLDINTLRQRDCHSYESEERLKIRHTCQLSCWKEVSCEYSQRQPPPETRGGVQIMMDSSILVDKKARECRRCRTVLCLLSFISGLLPATPPYAHSEAMAWRKTGRNMISMKNKRILRAPCARRHLPQRRSPCPNT